MRYDNKNRYYIPGNIRCYLNDINSIIDYELFYLPWNSYNI